MVETLVRGNRAARPAVTPVDRKGLQTPYAVLHLDESAVDGPPGPEVTLTIVMSFKPRAAGRTYTVEVRATDETGIEQRFEEKGQVTVQKRD